MIDPDLLQRYWEDEITEEEAIDLMPLSQSEPQEEQNDLEELIRWHRKTCDSMMEAEEECEYLRTIGFKPTVFIDE